MPRLSFTLLEGGGDVVDAVVVGADTRSRVPVAKAWGASRGVSGIQVIEVPLAPGKMQEGDNTQVHFLLFLANTTSSLRNTAIAALRCHCQAAMARRACGHCQGCSCQGDEGQATQPSGEPS